jgi:hypothetical protein
VQRPCSRTDAQAHTARASWRNGLLACGGRQFEVPSQADRPTFRGLLDLSPAESCVLALGGGSQAATASASAGESGALVHLTDSEAAASIDATHTLVGGTYAGPMANAEATGLGVTLRTGLLPSSYQAAVPIPEAAQAAFSKPVPLGILTGIQRIQGTQYTANGVLDLITGQFTRTGVNWNQAAIYVTDTAIDAATAGKLLLSGDYSSSSSE